ncbi:hypothetical protein J6590_057376 [Homalodisca vitripennis]|nr:hypothetical protein J6590_057376 [Homalodisca vitripennis]
MRLTVAHWPLTAMAAYPSREPNHFLLGGVRLGAIKPRHNFVETHDHLKGAFAKAVNNKKANKMFVAPALCKQTYKVFVLANVLTVLSKKERLEFV